MVSAKLSGNAMNSSNGAAESGGVDSLLQDSQLSEEDFHLSPLAGAPPDVCVRKLAQFRPDNFTARVLGRSLMDLYHWAVDKQAGDQQLLQAICSQRKALVRCNDDATQVEAFRAQVVQALRTSGVPAKFVRSAVNEFNTFLDAAQRDNRNAKLHTEACPACGGYTCAVCEYNCAPVPPPILFCANERCGCAIAFEEPFFQSTDGQRSWCSSCQADTREYETAMVLSSTQGEGAAAAAEGGTAGGSSAAAAAAAAAAGTAALNLAAATSSAARVTPGAPTRSSARIKSAPDMPASRAPAVVPIKVNGVTVLLECRFRNMPMQDWLKYDGCPRWVHEQCGAVNLRVNTGAAQ
ncbi:hypothetical protein JKP88DRAFT_273252 [Tribonema minus]|uniref:Uncharacterized protein n=1 Tax=Tribonema minus TaxID=303371 RepID=A0A835YX08_9STRA|nr:hypothetical protein JKP88DRAFT_273252 [Tribonema minus]